MTIRKTKAMKTNPNQAALLQTIIYGMEGIKKDIKELMNQAREDDVIILNPDFKKYIVYHRKLKVFTTIGARNIHHAFNKATKEFKGNYTGLMESDKESSIDIEQLIKKGWEFCNVALFNEVINSN